MRHRRNKRPYARRSEGAATSRARAVAITIGILAVVATLTTCAGRTAKRSARGEKSDRAAAPSAPERAAVPAPVTPPAAEPEARQEPAPEQAPAAEVNLFANGGFEDGVKGWLWEQWNNRPEPGGLERAGAFEGEACYRMTMPGELATRFMHTKSSPIESGRDYEFSVALWCENVPTKSVSIRLLQWGERPQPLGWACVPTGSGVNVLVQSGGTHDWKRFVVQIPAGSFFADTTKVNVFIEKKPVGLGVVKIDALSMLARGRGTAAPAKGGPAPEQAAQKKEAARVAKEAARVKRDGPNLLPGDMSFETSTNGWPGERDGAAADHGGSSLVLASDMRGAESPQYHGIIEPGRQYTLSFSARSDRRDMRVTFDAWHLRWSIMARSVVKVSPAWKRYEIAIPVQKIKRGMKIAVAKEGEGRLWLDAVQFEAGPATAFHPPEALSVGIGNTGAPGNILFVGDAPVGLEVGVYNARYPTESLSFSYATQDFYGKNVTSGREAIHVERGTAVRKTLQALPTRARGYYVTTVTVSDENGEVVRRGEVPFGVVRPPVVDGDDPDSFFGLHGGVPLEVMGRIGAKWTRSFAGWRWLEKNKGSISKTRADYQRIRRARFHHQETVKVTLMPDWARAEDGRVKDVADYCRFVGELTKRAAGLVTHFEIENEPYLVFPSSAKLTETEGGRYYAQVLIAASKAVKRANPDAVVLADPGHDSAFSDEVLKRAISAFDIYAIHPYAQARYIGRNGTHVGPEAVEMRNKFVKGGAYLDRFGGKQRIWVGELGWALDVNAPYVSPHTRDHAAYMVRSMVLARSVPRVDRIMYFMARGCVERKQYEYGLWRGVQTPLPAAVAYASLARVLHKAKPVRPLFESDLRAYAFERADGTPVIAVWKWRGEPVEMLADIKPGRARVVDMFGNELASDGNAGKLTVEASGAPVFVLGRGIGTEALCAKISAASVNMAPVTISVLLSSANSMTGFVKNNLPNAVAGTITLMPPGGGGGEGEGESRKMRLGASEAKSFNFDLQLEGTAATSQGVELVLRFDSDAGTVVKKVPLRAEPCARRRVALDETGDLSGWKGVPRIELKERGDVLPPDPGIGWDGPDDLSVTAGVAWDDEHLFFAATVVDDVYSQELAAGDVWQGDSIQIAFDTKNDAQESRTAYDANDYEYSIALTRRGPAAFLHAAPEGRTAGRVAEKVKVVVVRKGRETVYQVAFPWSELAPLTPLAGRMFGFNFIVNDNDGAGRAYWMGLSPGIGDMKAPFLYRKFVLAGD